MMNKHLPKITAFFIVLIFCISTAFAQGFELGLKTLQGIGYQNDWGYFQGGLELSGEYHISFERMDMSFGLNARTVQWGTQVSQSIILSRSFGHNVDISVELQNGLALFLPSPLYVYSIGLNASFPMIKSDKISAGLSVGARFTHCPAYRLYGSIDHVLEIPLGLFLRF
jgi:hypothetical protein